MSVATLSGHNLTSAVVALPSAGIWYADVVTEDDAALALGSSVSLVTAGLTLAGRIYRGEVYQGEGHYRVEGGNGGWRQWVQARAHQDDSLVRLSHVLAAVISDMPTGTTESLVDAPATGGTAGNIPLASERRLGDHWLRNAGVASSSLALLTVPWFIRPDGATYCGARATGAIVDPAYDIVEPVDMGARRIMIATEAPELWTPGLTLTNASLATPFVLRDVTIHVDSGSLRLEVTG